MISINQRIINSQKFMDIYETILSEADRRTFPNANFSGEYVQTDWDAALFLVSALELDGDSTAEKTALDVCFGALESTESTEEHKISAMLMLERMGNWPSISLAVERKYIAQSIHKKLPLFLHLDSINQHIQHTIHPHSSDEFLGNSFQVKFWNKVNSSNWLSISAPTSAGKSHIVKRWIMDNISDLENSAIFYIVPTRALIDEVARSLREDKQIRNCKIITIPWDSNITRKGAKLFVMTQERAQITLTKFPSLQPTIAFIDEAQKIGEGSRGILLEQVILKLQRHNPSIRCLFASPLTKNPEVLLERAKNSQGNSSLSSLTPSVKQTLYWVNRIKGKPQEWKIERINGGERKSVATAHFEERIDTTTDRHALLPALLSAEQDLNIIYVNSAACAENSAKRLYDYLGPKANIQNSRIEDVKILIREAVHNDYLLSKVIDRGIAFHYGNMPQLVRRSIELLYKAGLIRFLFCTSTLLEGINLPCTNIWMLNPKKGKGNPMTPPEFWNLAGRAGRWGTEFGGNIICIGTLEDKWDSEPPLVRTQGTITFASESSLQEIETVKKFIENHELPNDKAEKKAELESLSSYLFNAISKNDFPPALNQLSSKEQTALTNVVQETLNNFKLPTSILSAHPTLDPQSIEKLYLELSRRDTNTLNLLHPSNPEAYSHLCQAMQICETTMSAGFGKDGNIRRLAMLLLKWMRGKPMPMIISQQLNYNEKYSIKTKPNTCIRNVLRDIERIARFKAPKYLSCYSDILKLINNSELSDKLPDMGMMLELGVSTHTAISLISLGLSRTTAIQVASLIDEDNLNTDEVLEWLQDQNIANFKIPSLARIEVADILGTNLS